MREQRQRLVRREAGGRRCGAVAALLTTAACGGGGKTTTTAKLGPPASTPPSRASSTRPTRRAARSSSSASRTPTRSTRHAPYYGFVWNFAPALHAASWSPTTPKPGKAGIELVPDLADRPRRVTDGGKTYTYTLRTASSGRTARRSPPRTSSTASSASSRQDVLSGGPAYLHRRPRPQGPKYKGPYKDNDPNKLGLKSIETPDDKTIVFHLATPYADFELPAGHARPAPGASRRRTPAPSTPTSRSPPARTSSQSYTPGKSAVAGPQRRTGTEVVRPDPQGAAGQDHVTFNSNPDDIDNLLIKGDYDVDLSADRCAAGPQPKTAQAAQGQRRQHRTPASSATSTIATKVKPFDNIHCRKAVIYAADHDRRCRPPAAARTPVATSPPTCCPRPSRARTTTTRTASERRASRHVAKAKDELKPCGKPNGFSTTIAVRNNQPAEIADRRGAAGSR